MYGPWVPGGDILYILLTALFNSFPSFFLLHLSINQMAMVALGRLPNLTSIAVNNAK
jgi:hypothetical protein